MKDAMIVIAQFNQLQNLKLLRLLDQLSDEQRKADVGTNYTFGSIHGALDRMAGTLAMSLNMLSSLFTSPFILSCPRIFSLISSSLNSSAASASTIGSSMW